MRRMNLIVVTAAMIAAGIGISITLVHVVAKPETSSGVAPSIANMSPLEIMKERDKDLPTATNTEPF
jgi:hypothetical protein